MSDREGPSAAGGAPPPDEDLSLPKATVAKMITGASSLISFSVQYAQFLRVAGPELLPSDVGCVKETRDLVIECCVGEQPVMLSCV
jgi:hypothetical protein